MTRPGDPIVIHEAQAPIYKTGRRPPWPLEGGDGGDVSFIAGMVIGASSAAACFLLLGGI